MLKSSISLFWIIFFLIIGKIKNHIKTKEEKMNILIIIIVSFIIGIVLDKRS